MRDGFDVRWPIGAVVALVALGTYIPAASYPLTAVAGTLLLATGLALALDYRNAVDRYVRTLRVMPRMKISPRTFAKLSGISMSLVGLVTSVGASAMLILGRSPS